jgi:hypothetical protein
MNIHETALKAAQGQDTEDLLNHIAWDEVIHPKLLKTREQLVAALVNATLSAPRDGQDTKEQLAGKIQGIDFVITLIRKLVKEGSDARATLKSHNLNIT